MILIPPRIYRSLPEPLQYGIFAGSISGIVSAVVVSTLSFLLAYIETGPSILHASFRLSFFSQYLIIHLFSFIVWMGICLSLVAMSIPEQKKRLQQSTLFFTNAPIALLTYIFVIILTVITFTFTSGFIGLLEN